MAEYHTASGKLADPQFRHERASKAARARTTTDAHVKAIVKAAGRLTAEQLDELRGLLPEPAGGGDAAT